MLLLHNPQAFPRRLRGFHLLLLVADLRRHLVVGHHHLRTTVAEGTTMAIKVDTISSLLRSKAVTIKTMVVIINSNSTVVQVQVDTTNNSSSNSSNNVETMKRKVGITEVTTAAVEVPVEPAGDSIGGSKAKTGMRSKLICVTIMSSFILDLVVLLVARCVLCVSLTSVRLALYEDIQLSPRSSPRPRSGQPHQPPQSTTKVPVFPMARLESISICESFSAKSALAQSLIESIPTTSSFCSETRGKCLMSCVIILFMQSSIESVVEAVTRFSAPVWISAILTCVVGRSKSATFLTTSRSLNIPAMRPCSSVVTRQPISKAASLCTASNADADAGIVKLTCW
mmetsp:Transcript_40489/g.60008  ORF Transcript_40489/g.60008 Transcript_40489/m.60008 type:complete len:341 (+) Transcript_40489:1552-2574(+)